MIPYGCHEVDQQDIDAVVDVLKNQFLTQGQQVPKFESALCEFTGAAFATAVNSGTSALHIACLALGIGAGDLVWTSPNSFVASANCALYCGAEIDFVDIDPVTRNMGIQQLEQKLATAKKAGKLPKAIVVVHYSGMSCPMREIRALTAPYGIKIIEDASHALGATYEGHRVGRCEFSDACVLSFHPVKPITTAEGGAVLTNDRDTHQQLTLFGKHGITRDPALFESPADGPWYYEQIELGYNYRLSDLHAALGVSQLAKLERFTRQRQKLAARYFELLAGLGLQLPTEAALATSAWHLYTVELLQQNRAMVFSALQESGIGVNVHYIPIHLQPYYRKRGFASGDFPNAERFYQRAVTLPLYPNLSPEQQKGVVAALKRCLS